MREPSTHTAPDVSAVAMTKLPVGKERWICAASPPKPVSGSFGLLTRPLELAARPAILPDQAYQLGYVNSELPALIYPPDYRDTQKDNRKQSFIVSLLGWIKNWA